MTMKLWLHTPQSFRTWVQPSDTVQCHTQDTEELGKHTEKKSGGNNPQGTNYTVTCLPSRKLSKLDEPDMEDTAREARQAHKGCTPMDPHIWPSKSRMTSSNIHTYSSYVRIRDVALKTCQRRWMIERSGKRVSRISVLAARHDDDDDDEIVEKFMHTIYFVSSIPV